MSDDQELAKVLAGVSQQADETVATVSGASPSVDAAALLPSQVADPVAEESAASQSSELPALPDMSTFLTPSETPALPALSSVKTTPVMDSSLEAIKKDALVALRPLVDKLELGPEEKFDTYLLLIRSTDDKDLIAPAEAAAKNIADDARRAQALLDVIKEIDYLSGKQAS